MTTNKLNLTEEDIKSLVRISEALLKIAPSLPSPMLRISVASEISILTRLASLEDGALVDIENPDPEYPPQPLLIVFFEGERPGKK